jgi:sialate O-acetylesterase
MATSSDLGPGVHPVNKSGYGTRSARVALGAVYGKPVEIYGPIYKSHKIQEGKVIVSFDHVGKGLTCKKGESFEKLQGFAIAGEDGKFVWAEATIEGDTVVLSSPTVTKPVAVRYAWAAQHQWANFFNKDGLPAIPFRTNASTK